MSQYFPDEGEMARHTIFPGVHIRTAACEKMMMSVVTMEPGAVVFEHSHPHEQVGMILSGKATFWIGDEERTLGPGDLYRVPGGVKHKVIALEETVKVLDLFSPVRAEYR